MHLKVIVLFVLFLIFFITFLSSALAGDRFYICSDKVHKFDA